MRRLPGYPNAMKLAWNNNRLSQGANAAAFLTGAQWGEWNGRIAVSALSIGFGGTPVGERIDVIKLSEYASTATEVVTVSPPMATGRFNSVV